MSTVSPTPAPASLGIGVYSVTCVTTGKSYIGWSTNVKNRLGWHKSHLRNGNHSRREMQVDFVKYGEGSFSFEVLVLCANEHEAVREEALRIGESFKNGLSYNGIVPNANEARPRARKEAVVEAPDRERKSLTDVDRAKRKYYAVVEKHKIEYVRSASAMWDVLFYLSIRDEEQVFRLVDAFCILSGMPEAVLCLNAVDNPAFLHNIRIGDYEAFPWGEVKVVQAYVNKYVEKRKQAFAQEEYDARCAWIEAQKAERAQTERSAA